MTALKNKTRIRDLETIITLAAMLLIVKVIFNVEWLYFVTLALLLIALLSKRSCSKVAELWLRVTNLIGTTITIIIMTLIYYLFLTPIALLYRLLRKNQVMLKKDKNIVTYYNDYNKTFTKRDFEKMW